MTDRFESPLEGPHPLGDVLGVELFVKRDDLLPFPLAGNKVRKLAAEVDGIEPRTVVISNGAVTSNHCRTLALLAAQRGFSAHLVLHGSASTAGDRRALDMLTRLGATWELADASLIGATIRRRRDEALVSARAVHVVAGGCHTRAGAIAYRDAGVRTFAQVEPSWVIVASGTGATQGGLVAAAGCSTGRPHVVGISVGRSRERGCAPVAEAASWAGADVEVDFRDDFLEGGYGRSGTPTADAVALGWRHGLPLDHTYTGKAVAGLVALAREQEIPPGARVLFWHTGGLANYLLSDSSNTVPTGVNRSSKEEAHL